MISGQLEALVCRRHDVAVDSEAGLTSVCATADTPPLSLSQVEQLSVQQRYDLIVASMQFFQHWSKPWEPHVGSREDKDTPGAVTTCRGSQQ